MKIRFLRTALGTLTLILSATLSMASQVPAKPKDSVQGKTTPPATRAKGKFKRVDINSATKNHLKTIPGITDAYADKIIAGRPYLTKTRLLTQKVLPDDVYAAIKDRVEARQSATPTK